MNLNTDDLNTGDLTPLSRRTIFSEGARAPCAPPLLHLSYSPKCPSALNHLEHICILSRFIVHHKAR